MLKNSFDTFEVTEIHLQVMPSWPTGLAFFLINNSKKILHFMWMYFFTGDFFEKNANISHGIEIGNLIFRNVYEDIDFVKKKLSMKILETLILQCIVSYIKFYCAVSCCKIKHLFRVYKLFLRKRRWGK